MFSNSYKVMMIPVDQYNKMLESYDKALARIKELEEQLAYAGSMILVDDRTLEEKVGRYYE